MEEKGVFSARLLALGERLRRCRCEAGFVKPSTFAKAARVPAPTVSRIENGKRMDISVHTLAKLADAAGVSMEWLYWGDRSADGTAV